MPTSRTRSATAFLRRHGIILVIAVVATTTGAATAAQAGTTADLHGQGASHASRVLHFGVRFSPQNVIDVPPLQQHDGDYQPGDYVVFSDVLTNRAAHPVGTEGGSGLITQGQRHHYSALLQPGHPDPRWTAHGPGSQQPGPCQTTCHHGRHRRLYRRRRIPRSHRERRRDRLTHADPPLVKRIDAGRSDRDAEGNCGGQARQIRAASPGRRRLSWAACSARTAAAAGSCRDCACARKVAMASRASAASVSRDASSTARASTSASSTTSQANPSWASRSPEISSPSSAIATVACGPQRRSSIEKWPPPGWSPMRRNPDRTRASFAAIRTSAARARFTPAPTAAPRMAATVGTGMLASRMKDS